MSGYFGAAPKLVVYLITNTVNGKRYVGITTRGFTQRMRDHAYDVARGSKYYLHRGMRRHGIEAFRAEQISIADSLDELCQLEIELIAHYNTFHLNGQGYNLTRGGRGNWGWVPTPETCKRLGELSRERWNDPEWSQAQRSRLSEMWADPEFRASWYAGLLRKHRDPEYTIIRNARWVKLNVAGTEFTKRRLEGLAAKQAEPEFAVALRQMMLDRHADPVFATAHSQRMKDRHADPMFAAEHSARMSARNADPEFCEARREGIIRREENGEYRERRRIKLVARNTEPEFARQSIERLIALNADAKFQAARKAGIAAKWADPNYAAKHNTRLSSLNASAEFQANRIGKLQEHFSCRNEERDRIDPEGAEYRRVGRAMRAARKVGDKAEVLRLSREYYRLGMERRKRLAENKEPSSKP